MSVLKAKLPLPTWRGVEFEGLVRIGLKEERMFWRSISARTFGGKLRKMAERSESENRCTITMVPCSGRLSVDYRYPPLRPADGIEIRRSHIWAGRSGEVE